MKKQYVGFLLLFIAFMGTAHSAQNLEHVSLRLNWKHQFQFAGYYIAKEKGFYRDVGIDVDLLEHNGGQALDIYQELADGKVDFAATGPAADGYFLDGAPIVALGAIFQQTPRAWVSLSSKKLHSKQDLLGKRFAMHNRHKLTETSALLNHLGIAKSDIQIMDISYGVNNLINDEVDFIDAYVSNEVFALVEKNILHDEKRPLDFGLDFYGDGLFTHKKLLNDHPQLVEKFRQASFKGWEYAFTHLEETVDLIYRKYNDTLNKRREALQFEARQLLRLSYYPAVDIGEMSQKRWYRNAVLLNPQRQIKETDLDAFIYKQNQSGRFEWLYQAAFILLVVIAGLLSQRLIAKSKSRKIFNRN